MKVLIIYYTKTGHTLSAANATAEGIRSAGSEVDLVSVKEFNEPLLENYDAIIIASPCWKGSIVKGNGIADPMKKVLNSLKPDALKGKRCGGISVHSGAGAENTIRNIGSILMKKGCTDYRQGPFAAAGVPLSLWKGPSVKPEDIQRFRDFGAEFVK
ncbi:MAG: flavodoxin family protein [bacterium]